MKTYIIGEDSQIFIAPEFLEKEKQILYADNTKIEMCKADLHEDCHFPVHIRTMENDEHDSAELIDIVLKHKDQLAGLIKAFEEYLNRVASDEDTIPEKPIISLDHADCDTIRYECPVCGYEFLGYRSSSTCPKCRKMIDWGKDRPKIIKTLSWDEDEEDEDDE